MEADVYSEVKVLATLQGTGSPYALEPQSDLINTENFDLNFQYLKLFTMCVR